MFLQKGEKKGWFKGRTIEEVGRAVRNKAEWHKEFFFPQKYHRPTEFLRLERTSGDHPVLLKQGHFQQAVQEYPFSQSWNLVSLAQQSPHRAQEEL